MSNNPSSRDNFELWDDREWESYQRRPSFWEVAKNKAREDPAVPIFAGLTVAALIGGMKQSFFTRDAAKANKYMFARVGFQGAAIVACVWSIAKAFSHFDKKATAPVAPVVDVPVVKAANPQ